MPFNIFVVLVLLLCASEVHPQNFEGKPCRHAAKNLQGTCTLLKNCKSALNDVQNQVLPQICGLAATAPYVCCPTEEVGAKSRAKCLEYSKIANDLCSIRLGTNYKISEFAVGREFPHMAVLGYQDIDDRYYMCPGVLISERFVLTVARCLNLFFYGQPTYVRLGDLNLSNYDDDSDPVDVKVKTTYEHPDYDESKSYNNIGLIELEKDVTFSPYVRPICLHTKHAIKTKYDIVVTPYGFDILRGVLDGSLRRLPVQMQTNKQCRSSFANETDRLPKKIPNASMFCVAPNPALCIGELGGSLLLQSAEVDCMYDLVVMFIHVRNCSETDGQEVYTRVSHYIDWIESIVWP